MFLYKQNISTAPKGWISANLASNVCKKFLLNRTQKTLVYKLGIQLKTIILVGMRSSDIPGQSSEGSYYPRSYRSVSAVVVGLSSSDARLATIKLFIWKEKKLL